MTKKPNSLRHLDDAIRRTCGGSPGKFPETRTLMANAVVAQMLPDGVVKGGSAIKMRFGDATTRFTTDLDTATASDPEAYAEALGATADYLQEHDEYCERKIVHPLMEMEDARFLGSVLIDGMVHAMLVQANLEDGIQEWAEKGCDWHFEKIGEEEYLRRKASYDPAGADKRIVGGASTAISTGTRRRWAPNGWEKNWRSCRAKATVRQPAVGKGTYSMMGETVYD